MSKELLSVLERIAVALEKLADGSGAKAPVRSTEKGSSKKSSGSDSEYVVKILSDGKPWKNGGGESYFAALADGTRVNVGVREDNVGIFAKGEERRISARRQDTEFGGSMRITLWLNAVLDDGGEAATPAAEDFEPPF